MKTAFAPILSTLKWYKQAKLPRLMRDAFLHWQGIAYLEIRLCSIAQRAYSKAVPDHRSNGKEDQSVML